MMERDAKESARSLLSRSPPEGYLEDLTSKFQSDSGEIAKENFTSFFIFRLHEEWLAMPTEVVKQSSVKKQVHSIPHKSNDVLRGTANIDGQLKLVVALENILEIKPKKDVHHHWQHEFCRMFVIQQGIEEWVIEAHEVLGIRRLDLDQMENVPVTVSKSTANYFKGIYDYGGMHIGLLEEELLFFSLKRSVS